MLSSHLADALAGMVLVGVGIFFAQDPARLAACSDNPVTLPPGWARLETRPLRCVSAYTVKMIHQASGRSRPAEEFELQRLACNIRNDPPFLPSSSLERDFRLRRLARKKGPEGDVSAQDWKSETTTLALASVEDGRDRTDRAGCVVPVS
jgi:hypothetical protein